MIFFKINFFWSVYKTLPRWRNGNTMNCDCGATLSVRYEISRVPMETVGKLCDTPHTDFSKIVPIHMLMKCKSFWLMTERSVFLQDQLKFMDSSDVIDFKLEKFAALQMAVAVKTLWHSRMYKLDSQCLLGLDAGQLKGMLKKPRLLLDLQNFFRRAYLLCNIKGVKMAFWNDNSEGRMILTAMVLHHVSLSEIESKWGKEYDEYYCEKGSSTWILFCEFCENLLESGKFHMHILGLVMKKMENWFWLLKILNAPDRRVAQALYQQHLKESD